MLCKTTASEKRPTLWKNHFQQSQFAAESGPNTLCCYEQYLHDANVNLSIAVS